MIALRRDAGHRRRAEQVTISKLALEEDGMEDGRLVVVKQEPFNAETPLAALREAQTATESFYVRSHFATPAIAPGAWRLRLEGLVKQPFELTEDELRSLPARSVVATMECAGNDRIRFAPIPPGEPWGLGAVSTATWRGVSVRDLLEQARPGPSVLEIVFEGGDEGKPAPDEPATRFARSLPLSQALHPDTLLAYEMNGEPLTAEHGGPVRLVVPDWYGVASVKWVTRIAAIAEPFRGYYQERRYVFVRPDGSQPTPLSTMHVKSLITSHADGDRIPLNPQVLAGVAWSGDGEIVRVEVAVGGDGVWQAARLEDEARPHTWRRWEYEWQPRYAGRHVIRVRAMDAQGNIQPDRAEWNVLGYCNNSIQQVVLEAG